MTSPSSNLSDVVLAIATFRNDESVVALLDTVFSADAGFHSVLVVDSMGTTAVPETANARGWDVDYRSAETNLGSAGNLHLRMKLAAETDASFVYTINHDGHIDLDAIAKLAEVARDNPQIAAAYPTRFRPNRGASYDNPAGRGLPLPHRRGASAPADKITDVEWASSNGALYALEPVRKGIEVWPELWMCWEDTGYGWLLKSQGYRQVQVGDSVFQDDYEYRHVRLLGRDFYFADKPWWYGYYSPRNLIVVTLRNHRSAAAVGALAAQVAKEAALTVAFRDRKAKRLGLLARAVVDGVRDRTGKLDFP